MATVNLGAIRFNWKGAYNNGTAYVADDVVSSAGSSYICILASTGNAVSNATYWSQMSSAGTDGTDIGTTITTQGDVLYRDGSGLQRLAKGTASQSLTMNSGATAPEWTTPAAGGTNGWHLINSQTATNTASFTQSISGYQSYAIILNEIVPDSDGMRIILRFGTASGMDSTTGYDNAGIEADNYHNSTGSYHSSMRYAGQGNENHIWLSEYNAGNASGEGVNTMAYLLSPSSGTGYTRVFGQSAYSRGSGDLVNISFAGQRRAILAYTTIHVLCYSGNMTSGRMSVYGIKHN